MEVREIKICVDAESAKIYESAIFADRQKLDTLLSLRLKEFARKRRSLEVVMSDISRKAQARGLTPEILNDLLSEC
jgi:nickel-dependent lactate racemase